jgi:hypothetical protein
VKPAVIPQRIVFLASASDELDVLVQWQLADTIAGGGENGIAQRRSGAATVKGLIALVMEISFANRRRRSINSVGRRRTDPENRIIEYQNNPSGLCRQAR